VGGVAGTGLARASGNIRLMRAMSSRRMHDAIDVPGGTCARIGRVARRARSSFDPGCPPEAGTGVCSDVCEPAAEQVYDHSRELRMSKTMIRGLFVLVVAMSIVRPAHAKGPTVLLTVTGPTLSRALEITDSRLLASSSVYAGSFLNGNCGKPDSSLPQYQVFFHVELPKWMNAGVQVKYVVVYAADPRTGEGFIYLPGRGDDGYGLNARTILRDGHDGRWHRASRQWAAVLNAYLPLSSGNR
jgi:hypothetical protein